MQIAKWAQTACVTGAMLHLVLPLSARAESPASRNEPRIIDVQLDAQSSLAGQYLDQAGHPRTLAPVELRVAGQILARQSTDQQGRFRFPKVRGGVYQVTADDALQVCRAWAPRTAPPQARGELLLVAGQDVMRGQRPFADIVTNPIVILAAVGAAIAIPIAIYNSGDDTGS